MKTAALAFILAIPLIGASSCDQRFEEAQGIHTVKDPANPGHYLVAEDADGGKVGRVLSTAQGAGSGIPIVGQIIGGLGLLASLAHSIALARAKSRVQAENDEYDRTHTATSQGLQNFVNASPAEVGKALIEHLDAAHDAHSVDAAHQDDLQPTLKG